MKNSFVILFDKFRNYWGRTCTCFKRGPVIYIIKVLESTTYVIKTSEIIKKLPILFIFRGDIPKNSIRQLLYWASYFPCQMTNGYAVYRDTKEHYNEAIFQRRSPISEDCSKFIMDELDIDAMIESVKVERLTVKVCTIENRSNIYSGLHIIA